MGWLWLAKALGSVAAWGVVVGVAVSALRERRRQCPMAAGAYGLLTLIYAACSALLMHMMWGG